MDKLTFHTWRGWQGCRCKFSDVTLLCEGGGGTVVAAHKIVLATHRDRFESGVSGSVVAWTSYTRARPAWAKWRCWQRRGQSPRTSARSTPSWRTGAGGGLGPSPLDSTLVTITCQESIKLNMHLGSKTLSGLRICGMQFARFHKTCHVNIQFISVAVLSTPRSVNLTKSM